MALDKFNLEKSLPYKGLKERIDEISRRLNLLSDIRVNLVASGSAPRFVFSNQEFVLDIPSLDAILSDLDTLKSDVVTLDSDVETINSEIDTLQSQVEIIQSDIDTLEATVANLPSNPDTVNESIIDGIRTTFATVDADFNPGGGLLEAQAKLPFEMTVTVPSASNNILTVYQDIEYISRDSASISIGGNIRITDKNGSVVAGPTSALSQAYNLSGTAIGDYFTLEVKLIGALGETPEPQTGWIPALRFTLLEDPDLADLTISGGYFTVLMGPGASFDLKDGD